MKLRDLQTQIDRIMKADPKAGESIVVFGPEGGDHVVLNGGIYGRSKTDAPSRLILAPIKLDAVGGF